MYVCVYVYAKQNSEHSLYPIKYILVTSDYRKNNINDN